MKWKFYLTAVQKRRICKSSSSSVYDTVKSDGGRSFRCQNSSVRSCDKMRSFTDMIIRFKVSIRCSVRGKELMVEVRDTGKGIENIKQAMTPMYTSKPELERSGMGFSFMEAFMDNVHVISEPGEGTRVIMKKSIGKERETWITQSL